MKAIVKLDAEVEIKWVDIEVEVRYGDEDIPYDFPGRTGDTWKAKVDIDTGHIEGYPRGQPFDLHMKVVDAGSYAIRGKDDNLIAEIDGDYVPHGVVPGEYGDYLVLKIDNDGVITNWPKSPNISAFFEE